VAYLDLGCTSCLGDDQAPKPTPGTDYSGFLLPVVVGLGVYAAVRAIARPRVRRLAGPIGIVSGFAVNYLQASARVDVAQANLFATSKAALHAAAATGDCSEVRRNIKDYVAKGYLTKAQGEALDNDPAVKGCR